MGETSIPVPIRWGILRICVFVALVVLLAMTSKEIDTWRLNRAGGEIVFINDGIRLRNITTFQDLAHDGTARATAYFLERSHAALAVGAVRDIGVLGMAVVELIPVFKSPRAGWRFLGEFFTVIALRQLCLPLVTLPIPWDVVPGIAASEIGTSTGYYFSGHTANTLLLSVELTRYFASLPVGVLTGLITIYVAVVQLIMRAHYFVDIFTAIFVTLAVAEAAYMYGFVMASSFELKYPHRLPPVDLAGHQPEDLGGMGVGAADMLKYDFALEAEKNSERARSQSRSRLSSLRYQADCPACVVPVSQDPLQARHSGAAGAVQHRVLVA